MQDTMNTNTEVGIIGFWRNNKSGVLSCYHYFYVPKPCKRLLRYSMRKNMNGEASSASLFQIIYKSIDDELFFFFDQKVKTKSTLHLALLNLNVNRFTNNETIEDRHYNKRSNLSRIWPISDIDIVQKGIKAFFQETKMKQKKSYPNLVKNFQ